MPIPSILAALAVAALLLLVALSFYLAGRLVNASETRHWRKAATTDQLTGLTNRAGLDSHLDKLFGAGRSYAILLLDLNGFKPVNDTHGHRVGDMVLQRVAQQMRELPGLVARLGGDEFVNVVQVVQPADEALANLLDTSLQGLAELVRQAASVSTHINGVGIEVDASVGVFRVQPGDNPREAMHAADQAMYDAKRRGGGVTFRRETVPLLSDAPAVRLRDTRKTYR